MAPDTRCQFLDNNENHEYNANNEKIAQNTKQGAIRLSKKKNHQSEIFDIQRKIVANMTSESWEQIPHVSYLYEADVTDLLKAYRRVKESTKTNITINTVLIKLIVESLKAAPKLNSHLDFKRRLV